jgi:cellobiose-specific phosphotransferase system component IIC
VTEASLIEQQLEAMERPRDARATRLPWVLVVVGLLAIVGLGIHGYTAYATIARINSAARIDSANPIAMFQDIATDGPRIGATVEASQRSTYSKALEQFLLDGTGLTLGLVLVLAGLFIRANL